VTISYDLHGCRVTNVSMEAQGCPTVHMWRDQMSSIVNGYWSESNGKEDMHTAYKRAEIQRDIQSFRDSRLPALRNAPLARAAHDALREKLRSSVEDAIEESEVHLPMPSQVAVGERFKQGCPHGQLNLNAVQWGLRSLHVEHKFTQKADGEKFDSRSVRQPCLSMPCFKDETSSIASHAPAHSELPNECLVMGNSACQASYEATSQAYEDWKVGDEATNFRKRLEQEAYIRQSAAMQKAYGEFKKFRRIHPRYVPEAVFVEPCLADEPGWADKTRATDSGLGSLGLYRRTEKCWLHGCVASECLVTTQPCTIDGRAEGDATHSCQKRGRSSNAPISMIAAGCGMFVLGCLIAGLAGCLFRGMGFLTGKQHRKRAPGSRGQDEDLA